MFLIWSLFAVIAVAAAQQELESISPVSRIQQFESEKDEIQLDHEKSNSPLKRQVDPTVIRTRPINFYPSHYDVELRVVLEDFQLFNKHTVPAKVRLLGTTTENTTNIVLDAGYININRSSIRVITGTRPLQIEGTDHSIVKNTLLINLENEIGVGEELEIVIEYIAPLYQWFSSSGVYLVKYEDEGQYKQLVLSKFNSPVGRQFPTCSNAFPCFEDSQFKTTFNLTLFRKKDYTTEANGEFVGSDPEGIIINQLESEDLKTDNSFIENFVQSLALQMLGDREDPHVNLELSKSLKRYLEYVSLAFGEEVLSRNKGGVS